MTIYLKKYYSVVDQIINSYHDPIIPCPGFGPINAFFYFKYRKRIDSVFTRNNIDMIILTYTYTQNQNLIFDKSMHFVMHFKTPIAPASAIIKKV